MLYEILSGQTPYGAHRDPELLLRQARVGAVVPIEAAVARSRFPAELLQIVQRATTPSPNERYQDVLELLHSLQGFGARF